jgi:hypothetical protein
LPGTRNRATVEAREIATRLVDDPAYIQRLRERLLAGTAGPIEVVLWFYAHGKPPDRVERVVSDAARLSDAELRVRLEAALRQLPSPVERNLEGHKSSD